MGQDLTPEQAELVSQLYEEPVGHPKYLRKIPLLGPGIVDVYSVIEGFGITCPAIAHAAKKILCTGNRGKASVIEDIDETILALKRAKQLHLNRTAIAPPPQTPTPGNVIPKDLVTLTGATESVRQVPNISVPADGGSVEL